jgi:hypothetical protein
MTRTPRQAMQKLIEQNRARLLPHLHELFHRNIQDLTDGGLDREAVADAAWNVAATHKLLVDGPQETILQLRQLADYYEQQFGQAN